MADIVKMPKMSDTMEEGTIASWQKQVGDTVESGEVLAEIETDKATMELESYFDGVLLYIGPGEGDAVPVDDVIAVIGQKGDDVDAILKGEGGSSAPAAEKEEASAPAAPAAAAGPSIDVSSINANVVRMPKMSDTMESGTIAAWSKSVGDDVESGEVLAEVETDKATMELESYEDGKLLYIGVEAGDSIEVDGIIAIIGEEGADYKALLEAEKSGGSAAAASDSGSASESSRATASAPSSATSDSGSRIKASPLAKKIAADKGLDLAQVKGTGEGGRIIKADVESATPGQAAPKAAPAEKKAPAKAESVSTGGGVYGGESYEDIPLTNMRKVIAKRLSESKFDAPHFYVTMEIDMTKMWDARKKMNDIAETKISFNDIVMKACAMALRKHPDINSSWMGDKVRRNHHVNIGMAVALPTGLIVPVIRNADMKTLSQVSMEAKELGGKAKDGKLQPAEFSGNTFTISNLGMFGVEEFTGIINPPDSCILAVGGIKEVVVPVDGEFAVAKKMKVTLSADHRVADGAVVASFLKELKFLIEDPLRMII